MEPQRTGFAMAKGDGENSYSKNSKTQAKVNADQIPLLTESLANVTLHSKDSRSPLVVVDLGSSSGPNSIRSVALIISKLRLRLPKDAEFQAYFNDLPANDFNHLFQLLSVEDGAKSFYAAGVPGSFYDRLFPQSHVHVFHSTFCLHWMSKVPDAILDKNSPAYNGGDVWYMHSRSAVAEAYKEQSLLDLKNFLSAREAELQPGGLLFATFLGRPSSHLEPSHDDRMAIFFKHLNDICNDLISEGLLSAEQRDSFNIPYYLRSLEEVNGIIESFGGAFRVLVVKMVDVSRTSAHDMFPEASDEELAVKTAKILKAVMQSLLEAHLPKDVADIVWQRFVIIYQKWLSANRDFKRTSTLCTMSLIRM